MMHEDWKEDTPQGLLAIARKADTVVICAGSHFKRRAPYLLSDLLVLQRELRTCEIHFPTSELKPLAPVLLPHEVTRVLKSWYFLNLIEYTYRQDSDAEVTNNEFLRSLNEEATRMPTTQISIMERMLLGLARDLDSLIAGRDPRAVDPNQPQIACLFAVLTLEWNKTFTFLQEVYASRPRDERDRLANMLDGPCDICFTRWNHSNSTCKARGEGKDIWVL